MAIRSKRRTEANPEKSFGENASQTILSFFLKVLVPLVPIIAIFYVSGIIMNAEVTGIYDGLAPGLGAVKLDLNEENEQLGGKMILKKFDRYAVISGKMLDDNKMEIHMRRQLPGDIQISGAGDMTQSKQKTGDATQFNPKTSDSASDSKIPDDLREKPDDGAGEVTIQAKKDQNNLTGTMLVDGQTLNFSATRSSFAAFFGKRWINRSLNYFGFKVKV